MSNLFVYGTLMEPRVFEAVTGFSVSMHMATLNGYRRFAFSGECYPGIVPGEDSDSVNGALIFDLSPATWQRLDDYEGRMYERREVFVSVDETERTAAMSYVVKPFYCHKLTNRDWDYDDFRANHLQRYLSRDFE
ncbi:MAG: gamma-glutamylcyclotransferase family protein [Gammaproteobacteria bacterium]